MIYLVNLHSKQQTWKIAISMTKRFQLQCIKKSCQFESSKIKIHTKFPITSSQLHNECAFLFLHWPFRLTQNDFFILFNQISFWPFPRSMKLFDIQSTNSTYKIIYESIIFKRQNIFNAAMTESTRYNIFDPILSRRLSLTLLPYKFLLVWNLWFFSHIIYFPITSENVHINEHLIQWWC